ncbi:MAG: hypothetical protein LUD79_04535 [Oscillospiraceae bacterium]|nr:hypothetical protein [Oscillospiraceae bacterium]
MSRLLTDVNRYARPKAIQWVGLQEAEDVLMELDCQVLTHIAGFLRQSDDKTPYQRQAWLKTLLQRTLYDYVDRNHFGETYRTRKSREAQGQEVQTISLTSLESWQEQGGDLADSVTLEEQVLQRGESQVLNEIIETACALRVGPAEVLTFLYHNVVFFLEGDSEKKGVPAQTAQRLEGKTLGELRDRLPAALEQASGHAVPAGAFAALDQKLEGRRDEVYTFNAAKISASASYSKRRVAEKRRKHDEKPDGEAP